MATGGEPKLDLVNNTLQTLRLKDRGQLRGHEKSAVSASKQTYTAVREGSKKTYRWFTSD